MSDREDIFLCPDCGGVLIGISNVISVPVDVAPPEWYNSSFGLVNNTTTHTNWTILETSFSGQLQL